MTYIQRFFGTSCASPGWWGGVAMDDFIAMAEDVNFVEIDIESLERLTQIAVGHIKKRPENVGPGHLSALLLFIVRMRMHITTVRGELLISGFICTCTHRMLLMDLLSIPSLKAGFADSNNLIRELLELRDLADELKLFNLEEENTVSFEPCWDIQVVLQEIKDNGTWKWDSSLFSSWNRVAFAVCFAQQPTEEDYVVGDISALRSLAEFDADCMWRVKLQTLLEGAEVKTKDKEKIATAMEWGRRSNKNVNDDLFQIGKEAIIIQFMTPEAMRRGAGAPSKRLAGWDSSQATKSHEAAAEGFKLLDKEKSPYHSTLFLSLFGYTVKQLYDLNFMELFFVRDILGDKALQKIAQYRADRLVNPPPLLIYSMGKWYLMSKSGEASVYKSGIQAIFDWLLFVKEQRANKVFLSKDISHIINEITNRRVAEDTRLLLRTEKLM